jgi:hypothetical protein
VQEETRAACAALYVDHAMVAVLFSVLLAALFPGGGLCVNACLQMCCSAAAGIAVLMHQQHRVHLAFVAIIDDLRRVMSHQILPLTNQDDHYLYSLIFASTALRKSESTPHVTWPSLQLPGSSLSYELAPAHAVVCCCVLAFMAFWLAATRYLDLWTVESARRKAKHS